MVEIFNFEISCALFIWTDNIYTFSSNGGEVQKIAMLLPVKKVGEGQRDTE